MSLVCKMADNGRLAVDQKVKVVLLYAETKSVVATQRRFRAHFGTGWVPCKQTIYRLSLWTIFQPMRINSLPDVKCFCDNKNVLRVQSMVWQFVCHPAVQIILMNTNIFMPFFIVVQKAEWRTELHSQGEICKCHEVHNILSNPFIMSAIHSTFYLILTCQSICTYFIYWYSPQC